MLYYIKKQIKNPGTNPGNAFKYNTPAIINNNNCNYAIFSHPDCTVGFGIAPNRPHKCGSRTY